jgi:hypothetical protein
MIKQPPVHAELTDVKGRKTGSDRVDRWENLPRVVS